ncbi:MAG TPA: polysaccharide biosynthesis protein, partial [Bacteroidales bacterium]|nr:polysaccharide biosynthesis protein [Bacteroidales bacterium]
MGIIRKQTILGTIYTYLGAGLGVFTNLILLAWFFTPEQIGLLNVLVAYSLLFSQLANLGFDNVTIRLFPYFR